MRSIAIATVELRNEASLVVLFFVCNLCTQSRLRESYFARLVGVFFRYPR